MKTTTLFVGDENGLRSMVSDRRVSTVTHNVEFGEKLRQRRMALGFTQDQLAEIMSASYVTISRLETASMPLTDKMRARVEAVLDALEENNS